jgi:hypothetical protein
MLSLFDENLNLKSFLGMSHAEAQPPYRAYHMQNLVDNDESCRSTTCRTRHTPR